MLVSFSDIRTLPHFKRIISCLSILILSCILITKHTTHFSFLRWHCPVVYSLLFLLSDKHNHIDHSIWLHVSAVHIFLWTSALPDDGWCGQPKRVVVSKKDQIYRIYSSVYQILQITLDWHFLFFSAFMYVWLSLLSTSKASVFFCVVNMFSPNKIT